MRQMFLVAVIGSLIGASAFSAPSTAADLDHIYTGPRVPGPPPPPCYPCRPRAPRWAYETPPVPNYPHAYYDQYELDRYGYGRPRQNIDRYGYDHHEPYARVGFEHLDRYGDEETRLERHRWRGPAIDPYDWPY